MSFSDDYVYENYKKYYNIAEKAKKEGDFIKLKKALYKAAEFLEMIAKTNTGKVREEQMLRVERMRSVAASIKEDVLANAKNNASNNKNSFGGGAVDLNYSNANDIGFDEVSSYLTIFEPNQLKFGFEGVVGLNEAKNAIKRYVINPRLYPESYTYDILDGASILLEGPPGTGKTTFAKALAKELNQPLVVVNISSMVNCYVGETGKNIDKVFAFLRNYAGTEGCEIVAFFDELDEIAKRRGSDDKASESAVPALLRNLGDPEANSQLLIIANTNHKEILDPAILSRFHRAIYIPLPDGEAREHLIKLKLSKLEREYLSQLDMPKLVMVSKGMNGRQIDHACKDFKLFISEVKAGISTFDSLTDKFVEILSTASLN